jgi:membrane fusion protein (multidrug efflux system)
LPVETATVQLQPLSSGLQTVGSLRADESVVVRPEIAGRIQRIHFTEGGRVAAGQPLFTLDGSLAQAALNEASANLDNSRRAAACPGTQREKLIGSPITMARASLGRPGTRVLRAHGAVEDDAAGSVCGPDRPA